MIRSLALAVLLTSPLLAQGTKSDYDRALSLQKTTAKVLRATITPHWLRSGDAFWYRREVAAGKFENVLVDCVKGTRVDGYEPNPADTLPVARETQPRPSRDGGDRSSLTFINKTPVEAQCYWIPPGGGKKPYSSIKPGEQWQTSTFEGHVWSVETPSGEVLGVYEAEDIPTDVVIENVPAAPKPTAPNATVGFIRNHNVWLRDGKSGEETQLTSDGSENDSYAEPVLISPDGTRLVAMQVIPEQRHTVSLVESSPKNQVEPILRQMQYLKAGDKIAKPRPRLFSLETRKPIPVADDLFPVPWSLSDVEWKSDSSEFTFLYNQRYHQLLRMVGVDREGKAFTVVEERSSTFLDYSNKEWHQWLGKSSELLWMSERDGWNQLYLFDAKTGALKNQVTKGEWVVRKVERVDEDARQIWMWVAGVIKDQDPYYLQLARVNFDGTGFTLLTRGDGTRHRTLSSMLSPNGQWIVDTYSRVDMPPVTEVRRASDGNLMCEVDRADASQLLSTPWTMPERFSAKGRDGATDIYGVIYKPSNFDASKKYPVIEEIYAGPHGYFVPKEWGRQIRQHALAELGFIVVQIDGMGTNWRSRAFHDVAWRNLKDAGFADRIAWMKAAASSHPWMDLSRVGIYGGSAGGQNALAALLHHGDFYKVGVSDCGCHDNRMDKIWWNEAWLGEMGPWYEENSNVVHASKLQGKLMLIVGEVDSNVDPASTMQVVNALVKADKDFDLLVMPGTNHGAAENPYASRRRMDFFVRHLLDVEPRG